MNQQSMNGQNRRQEINQDNNSFRASDEGGGGESGGMEGSHIIDGRPGSEGNVEEKE